MAVITAQQVSTLRKMTCLPLMACKMALVSSNGDIDNAIDLMRKDSNQKITVKVHDGKLTGVYCRSGFIGNIIAQGGAKCSKCGVFVSSDKIERHNCLS